MASFKSKIFSVVLRNRHLLQGKFRKPVIDFNSSMEEWREQISKSAAKMTKLPKGISVINAHYPEFYAEWVIPANCKDEQIILYFHGGGFVSGNCKDHRSLVANFSNFVGVKSLVFDYSLAPEKPFPAAVNDSVSIYSWLLDNGYLPENIVFVGDSAGGGLELSCLLLLKEQNIPLPIAVVAMSPCTDMTISGQSHKTKAKADPCTPKGANETWLSYYVGDGNPSNPIMSPLFGNLEGLPPIMIQVGVNETLLDDSTRFAEKAKKAGVDITLHVWEGMFHCFPMLAPMFREATEAMNEISNFIRFHLNK